jgi:hypothetical protein
LQAGSPVLSLIRTALAVTLTDTAVLRQSRHHHHSQRHPRRSHRGPRRALLPLPSRRTIGYLRN